ncbi:MULTISPECIES: GrpB family protein [Arthrobacter]|uniref:GrpB family protein n=1 Tax=Arthrobacter TaxID=1663 RepID=UPI0033954A2D
MAEYRRQPDVTRTEHIGGVEQRKIAVVDYDLKRPDRYRFEEQKILAVLQDANVRVRGPGHRMVRTSALDVHVHVMEAAAPAADAYLLLRNRLRSDPADRRVYEETKRILVSRDRPDMNAYSNAKSAVIAGILHRAGLEK